MPVPESSTSVGGRSPTDTARQDVCPPTRSNSRPDTAVDPRTPQKRILTGPLSVLALVTFAQCDQGVCIDLVFCRDCDSRLGRRPQGGGPAAALDEGPLAHDRARPEVAERLPVDLDREHAVEQQVELLAELVLRNEHLAFLELADLRLLAAAHDHRRQLTLEC